MTGLRARAMALRALRDIEHRQRYAHLALPAFLARTNLDQRDRRFVTDLVYGVIRRRLTLDWLLGQFAKRPASEIDEHALAILRLGLYQILFMDRVPDHSAVNTSVALAKRKLKRGAEKFVNAVLRESLRQQSQLPWPSRSEDEVGFLSAYYSHPRWQVELWLKEIGTEKTEALLEADNQRPRVTVRPNTLRTTTAGLRDELEKAGIRTGEGQYVKSALSVSELIPAHFFKGGLAYAQDEASQLVALVVDPQRGESVIEIGAAPGGKATGLAQLMGDEGEIAAVEINRSRLDILRENCRRLGVKSIRPVLADATNQLSLSALGLGEADRVLLDAPCSGLGVLARRPDARWRKDQAQIAELALLQGQLLSTAASLVRTHGVLVYSVCTMTSAETTEVIAAFLTDHPEFAPEAFDLPSLSAPEGTLQLWPDTHGLDGMFIAKLRRR